MHPVHGMSFAVSPALLIDTKTAPTGPSREALRLLDGVFLKL